MRSGSIALPEARIEGRLLFTTATSTSLRKPTRGIEVLREDFLSASPRPALRQRFASLWLALDKNLASACPHSHSSSSSPRPPPPSFLYAYPVAVKDSSTRSLCSLHRAHVDNICMVFSWFFVLQKKKSPATFRKHSRTLVLVFSGKTFSRTCAGNS